MQPLRSFTVILMAWLLGEGATGAGLESSVDRDQLPPADLPMREPPSRSVIGPTLKTSVHRWPEKRHPLRRDAPNVLLIMNDDAGFGHPDTFGGPVHTPSLSRVAAAGVAYNRFHNTAICSPTRAALLTGRNSHAVGAGQITQLASGFPGYDGKIPKSAATVAKVLAGYGYDTAAFGKWHNTPVNDLLRTGPFDQYPTGLGFRYFYGFLAGETSQWQPRLFENTNPIEPPKTPEQGYHLTEDLAAQAIKFIRNNRALTPDRPFFIYFAPGGTHGPHHVATKWADKYKGKFDEGWEKLRNTTFTKQKAMGWIPETAELTPIDPTMTKWEDVPASQRAFQLRLMEVYAGFLEHTDTQHGKILDELDRQQLTNNTLIIYVFADNGASAEGLQGTISELLNENSLPSTVDQQIEVLEREFGGLGALGSKHLNNMYHSSWAWAGDAPFKSTKLDAAHLGGTRTPLVVSWPRVIEPDRIPRTQFHHVCDVAPTIYEAIGIRPPGAVDGITQDPLQGVSMAYSFNNASAAGRRTAQYFEVMGSRAVYKDGWWASAIGPRLPWAPNASRIAAWDPDTDVWELYDLAADYSQAHDLARSMPEKLAEMKALFLVEAAQNKVLPIGAGLYTAVYHPEQAPKSSLTEWNLYTGQARIAESNAPLFRSGFSSVSTIELDVPANASGVLYCVGGGGSGFTVFMDGGYLHAEYGATLLYTYKVRSDVPVKPGPAKIEVRLIYDAGLAAIPTATLTLLVDGAVVGEGRVEKSCQVMFDASETFDVGMDLGSPVSLQYSDRLPFEFSGELKSLSVKYVQGSPPTAGPQAGYII
uniref:Sulfatase N-terminal domain-containing protein n=1 Tax=Alexandrium monilatum TaxID=311494 RepID=A0A7S4TAS1_9DINO